MTAWAHTAAAYRREMVLRVWLGLLLTIALNMSCSTAPRHSTDSQANLRDLKSECVSYHLQHHREDEKAANVVGFVEFTDFEIVAARVKDGEALVSIKVANQKRITPVGRGMWVSAEQDGDWQERWRRTKEGWVFVERVSKPSGIKIY